MPIRYKVWSSGTATDSVVRIEFSNDETGETARVDVPPDAARELGEVLIHAADNSIAAMRVAEVGNEFIRSAREAKEGGER